MFLLQKMIRHKIAAALLIISAILFATFVLLIEKVGGMGIKLGLFAVIATGALFLYLYWQRLSKTRRWILLILFIVPSLAVLLGSFFKS